VSGNQQTWKGAKGPRGVNFHGKRKILSLHLLSAWGKSHEKEGGESVRSTWDNLEKDEKQIRKRFKEQGIKGKREK